MLHLHGGDSVTDNFLWKVMDSYIGH